MLNHRPVDVDDERLYLLGLGLLVLVPSVAAVGWFGLPAGTATLTVDTAGVDGPVNVTVGDPVGMGGGNTEIEAQRTLTGDGGVVFETRVPTEYAVGIRAPESRCSVDVALTRENEQPAWFTNHLVVGHVHGNCSDVGVTVGVRT